MKRLIPFLGCLLAVALTFNACTKQDTSEISTEIVTVAQKQAETQIFKVNLPDHLEDAPEKEVYAYFESLSTQEMTKLHDGARIPFPDPDCEEVSSRCIGTTLMIGVRCCYYCAVQYYYMHGHPACYEDPCDCSSDENCVNNQCVPICEGCNPPNTCQGGICTPPSDPCQGVTCSSGCWCNNGVCVGNGKNMPLCP